MSSQLTLSQAAGVLKVSEKSIRRYIKAGRLKAKLIKGDKGNEYRIEKKDLENLTKPPRGKRSHKKYSKVKKEQKKSIKPESVGEIIEQTAKEILQPETKRDLVDYKMLYDNLLARYEQSLIMIGSLEAQLTSMSPKYNERIEKLEESKAKQEELIIKLYQVIKYYEDKKF